ncbi:phage/plasmid primase, P4 family [Chloroflexota bacterium]
MRSRCWCYDYNSGIYRFNGESVIKEETQKWLDMLGMSSEASSHFVNEVIGYIKRATCVNREQLNADFDIVVVKNGVLDLNTGKVYEHSKDYKATIAIPVAYDAVAECPRIDQFVREVVEQKDISLLYEVPAWCLTPYSGIQRLVILLGEGANGKTVYLEVIRRFLGRNNCTVYSLQSLTTNRFAIAGLYDKLANISPELPSNALKQAGPLKTLTGLDTIEAEKKFKDSFNFVNTAKMIFASNAPPEINEDTLAVWRRFVTVDFPFTFKGDRADKNLLAKLTTEQELSGLLNKALDGLIRLKRNGDFTYTTSIEDTRAKYLLASNPASAFIEDHCEFSAWGNITKEELYQAFMKFCEDNKLPGMAKKAFGRKIKRAYNLSEERESWRGINLKEETQR